MRSRREEVPIDGGLGDASPRPLEEWLDMLTRMYGCLTVPGLVFGCLSLVARFVPSLLPWLTIVILVIYLAYFAYGKLRRSRRWEVAAELFLILVGAAIASLHK
jgi:uncharacterized membrane protein